MIIMHCNNTSYSKCCYYTKGMSNKNKSGYMHKNKMKDEDVLCIECAGVKQSDQSAPIDLPKLRFSSEI